MTTTGSRWNQVAGRAAIVNGAVFVVVPMQMLVVAFPMVSTLAVFVGWLTATALLVLRLSRSSSNIS